MKITVDRTQDSSSGALIFTITVSEPHDAPFTQIDADAIIFLERCKQEIEKLGNVNSSLDKLPSQAVNAIHELKSRTFNRVKDSLEFSIRNSLQPKFTPICQEIYNWIYDNQKDYLKKWMQELDPQRTKYYFDNDKTKLQEGDDNQGTLLNYG